jgi:hypothetical protein
VLSGPRCISNEGHRVLATANETENATCQQCCRKPLPAGFVSNIKASKDDACSIKQGILHRLCAHVRAQEAETVEAQEARIVAAYESALRLMQSGAAADAQVLHCIHPCFEAWRRWRLRLCLKTSWPTAASVSMQTFRRATVLLQSQDELRALLEEPLLVAVELPDDAAEVSGRAAAAAMGTPSLAAQIKFLALKNLAGSLAAVRPYHLHYPDGQVTCANCMVPCALLAIVLCLLWQGDAADAASNTLQGGAALEALQLYAQAALLDAGDIVLWNRMGVLVRTFKCVYV